MLTEKQIIDLLNPIVNEFKKIDGRLNKKKLSYDEMPDFHSCYKTACEYHERIKIHAEIGGFPERLFKEHSPNMTGKEFDYMKGNFKQNTLPVYSDYISTITRPFSDGNWGLDYTADDEDYISSKQTFQEYVENEIEFFGSLENYWKSIIPHVKTKDANGIICIKPLAFEYTENLNEEGELVIDTGKLYEPQPVYYSCEQVLSHPEFDNEYFIVHLEEKSPVTYASKNQKVGHIFEIIDEDNIWHYEQVGNLTDYKFELTLYFNHNEGVIPAKRLGGIPQLSGKGILWQSPFIFSTDLLDLALMNRNYHQCSINKMFFPVVVMLGNPCGYKYTDESNQTVVCDKGDIFIGGKIIQCPQCFGTGLKNRISPLGTVLLAPSDYITEGDSKFSAKPYEIVSPSKESMEYLEQMVDRDLDKARQILHLHTTSSTMKGGGDITATELGLDVKALYAFVKNISDQTFALFEFMLDRIGYQRYAEKYKKPVLTYPVTFDFNTEEDYLRQITAAQNAKVPAFVIHSIIYKYLQTLYYNEKATANVFILIVNTDRFLVASSDDVIAKFNLGLAEKWEVVLHDSAIELVKELVMDDEKFFEKDLKDQRAALITKSKLKADSIVKPVAVATSRAIGDILNPTASV